MKKELSTGHERRFSYHRQRNHTAGARWRGYLSPPWPWIAILGVDGSGKSSVLEALAPRFVVAPVAGVEVIHRRPGVVYSTGDKDGDAAGDGSTEAGRTQVAHYGKPAHGTLKSAIKVAAMVLDWLIGYWSQLARRRARGYLLFSDRHALLDLLVDPLRYRYSGPPWLVHLGLRLVPMPDLVLLLDAPVDILQARKRELSPEEATRQRNAYLELMLTLPNSTVVDSARPLDQVVASVEQIILDFIKSQPIRNA